MRSIALRSAVFVTLLALGACVGVAPRLEAPVAVSSPGALPRAHEDEHFAAAHAGLVDSHGLALPHVTLDVPAPTVDEAALDDFAPADGAITGRVSWYGKRFAGRRTANGERFDPKAMTMAHRQLPFGTRVRVTNPTNGLSVIVRVNDRGPYVGARIADLSHAAARRLGMVDHGVIVAQLEVLADETATPGGATGETTALR